MNEEGTNQDKRLTVKKVVDELADRLAQLGSNAGKVPNVL